MLPVDRLNRIKNRVSEIHAMLSDPAASKEAGKIQVLGKELSKIEPIARLYDRYQSLSKEITEVKQLLTAGTSDDELVKLYQEEKKTLLEERSPLEHVIEKKLLGDEKEDAYRSIIVEIRAGTGGEEASLFARDLFRMYSQYAANHQMKIDVMNTSVSGKGGIKEIIFGVSGERIYSRFKYEMGIHRVQRVPETEASGRIHTSAATVAVLPEVDEVEVKIKPEELRIEVCRSGGPGGQGVNTTDSAVQIVHLPTGLTVRCQDERSQLKNKGKAMRVLRARLFKMKQEEQDRKISENRKRQIGSGDRSGKIRTYNFPDGRITDHRIGLTTHNLDAVMNGQLDEVVEALQKSDREQKLSGKGNPK